MKTHSRLYSGPCRKHLEVGIGKLAAQLQKLTERHFAVVMTEFLVTQFCDLLLDHC
jgi:hypothetical protein